MNIQDLYIENSYYTENLIEDRYSKEFIRYCFERNVINAKGTEVCFTYVGAIVFQNHLIYVFPKYYREYTLKDEEVFSRILLYLDVIQKAEKSIAVKLNENEFCISDSDNPFSVYKGLLEYYSENNIYRPTVTKKTNSFEDRIHWQKTVEEHYPFINGNNHLYLDVVSNKTTFYKNHIISELQKFATQTAYDRFGNFSSVYKNPNLDFIDVVDEYGSEYCLNVIEQALNISYADNELTVLNLLRAFIINVMKNDSVDIELIGTNAFYHVWEVALKRVLKDEFEDLKEIIPKPLWVLNGSDYGASNTIIPDILIQEDEVLLISDAKYYLPQFNSQKLKISGQPGVESITKQIVYKQIFSGLEPFMGFTIKNSFIFPCVNQLEKEPVLQEGDLKVSGTVGFKALEESDIDLIFIPPARLFMTYLANIKLNLNSVYE